MILWDIQYKHYGYWCRDMKYGQFGTEPTYHTLYTCSRDSTHIYKFMYMAFCLSMVYFTPIWYLPNGRPYDGGVRLLNLFWHVWEMADVSGKTVKFPKMPWLWQPTYQTKGEILEISHLTIHKTPYMRHNLMHKVGPMAKFPKMPWL